MSAPRTSALTLLPPRANSHRYMAPLDSRTQMHGKDARSAGFSCAAGPSTAARCFG